MFSGVWVLLRASLSQWTDPKFLCECSQVVGNRDCFYCGYESVGCWLLRNAMAHALVLARSRDVAVDTSRLRNGAPNRGWRVPHASTAKPTAQHADISIEKRWQLTPPSSALHYNASVESQLYMLLRLMSPLPTLHRVNCYALCHSESARRCFTSSCGFGFSAFITWTSYHAST